jgi:hypothetical protein
MKCLLFATSSLFVLIASNEAIAADPDPCGGHLQVRDTIQIKGLLSGNTVCTSDSQEQHRPNNQLWDYKMGPNDIVDPTSQVGTWSISDNKVHYTYGNQTYHNEVYSTTANPNATNVKLCFFNGTTPVSGRLVSGIKGCQ